MNAIAPLPRQICTDAITPTLFPEGVWRCPVALVVEQSTSAYASLTRTRMLRRDLPVEPAVVFMQAGRLFGVVDWLPAHGVARLSMLFALDLATDPPRVEFGRRTRA